MPNAATFPLTALALADLKSTLATIGNEADHLLDVAIAGGTDPATAAALVDQLVADAVNGLLTV